MVRVIIAPETETTIHVPEVRENGKLISPTYQKIIAVPPVFENRVVKTLVEQGKTYETLSNDIPKVKITRQLAKIDGYALVDQQGVKLKSWSYKNGNLILNSNP